MEEEKALDQTDLNIQKNPRDNAPNRISAGGKTGLQSLNQEIEDQPFIATNIVTPSKLPDKIHDVA